MQIFSLSCFLSVPQYEITVPFGLLGLWFGYRLYTLWVKFWFDLEEKVKKSRSFIALSSEMVTHVGDSLHLGFRTRGQTGIRLMLRLLVLRAVANIDLVHYFEDQMLEYQVRKCCRDLTKR